MAQSLGPFPLALQEQWVEKSSLRYAGGTAAYDLTGSMARRQRQKLLCPGAALSCRPRPRKLPTVQRSENRQGLKTRAAGLDAPLQTFLKQAKSSRLQHLEVSHQLPSNSCQCFNSFSAPSYLSQHPGFLWALAKNHDFSSKFSIYHSI